MLEKNNFSLKYHFLALIFMSACLIAGLFLVSGQALKAQEGDNDAESAAAAELNRQIADQRAKLDQLSEKINEYNANIKKASGQAASLQNQIYIMDNQIAKAELDIEAKQEETRVVGLEIDRTNLEIKAYEEQIAKDKEKLAGFIRLIARYDQQTYLNILLANNSFSEFFDQLKYTENISEDLQATLDRVQEAVKKLNDEKDRLDKKKQQLSDLLNTLESQKIVLEDQKNTKQYLIAETKQSEKKYQTLVKNLKQEEAAANAAIASLEKQLRAKLQQNGSQEEFNSLGNAALSWPTSSRRITAYFHDPDYPYRNLFEHSGIDLGVPQGTAVKAAEAGYVATAALGTKWYGNYIMIIHSNNLATLYAHLSSVNVKADDYVTKGQVIGLSGNTGFSSGPHLHFEVRSNGVPVNPLNYLP